VLSTIFSGSDDLIVILVAVVVLFGGGNFRSWPKTQASLAGISQGSFEAEAGTTPAANPVAGATSTPVLPMAPVAPVLVQAPPAAATGDYVTVTRGSSTRSWPSAPPTQKRKRSRPTTELRREALAATGREDSGHGR